MEQSILLLHQEQGFLALMKNYLKRHMPYKIYSYCNPVQALEVICLHGIPNLIITDLLLPGMGGIDFLAETAHLNESINAIIFTDHPEALPHKCPYPLIINGPGAFEQLIQTVQSILI
jgi:DNA-binding NtrC family response regulator